MAEEELGKLPSFHQPTKARLEHQKDRRFSFRRSCSFRAPDSPVLRPDSARSASSKRSGQDEEVKKPRFKTYQSQQRERHCTQECLKVVPLFQQCSAEFVEMLAEQVRTQIFNAGCDIVAQGETGYSMYVLNRGEVEVLVNGSRVAVLGDGSVFGEMAAISRNPVAARRTATVRSKTLCDCRVIGRDALSLTLMRFKADEVIIEAEANKRLAELRKMGLLQAAQEWWRPLPVKVVPQEEALSKGGKSPLSAWNKASSVVKARRVTVAMSGGDRSPSSPSTRMRVVLRRTATDMALAEIQSTNIEIGGGGHLRQERVRATYSRARSIENGEFEVRASLRKDFANDRCIRRANSFNVGGREASSPSSPSSPRSPRKAAFDITSPKSAFAESDTTSPTVAGSGSFSPLGPSFSSISEADSGDGVISEVPLEEERDSDDGVGEVLEDNKNALDRARRRSFEDLSSPSSWSKAPSAASTPKATATGAWEELEVERGEAVPRETQTSPSPSSPGGAGSLTPSPPVKLPPLTLTAAVAVAVAAAAAGHVDPTSSMVLTEAERLLEDAVRLPHKPSTPQSARSTCQREAAWTPTSSEASSSPARASSRGSSRTWMQYHRRTKANASLSVDASPSRVSQECRVGHKMPLRPLDNTHFLMKPTAASRQRANVTQILLSARPSQSQGNRATPFQDIEVRKEQQAWLRQAAAKLQHQPSPRSRPRRMRAVSRP